ncbi:MAG: EscE/YscE/SsaE family type III secretion system needle protein co-chaperone [Burkholderiales bacterium]
MNFSIATGEKWSVSIRLEVAENQVRCNMGRAQCVHRMQQLLRSTS